MRRDGEPNGSAQLDPGRAILTTLVFPSSGEHVKVRHPQLQNVAQGYRQQQTLANLLSGAYVRNPAYWQQGRRVKPRRSELASWFNFRQRLLDAGYALEVHREPGCATGDELYRLRTLEAVE